MVLGDPLLTQVLARLSAELPDVHIVSGTIGNGRQVGQALSKGLIDCAVTVDGLSSASGILAEHVMMAQRGLIRLPALDPPGRGCRGGVTPLLKFNVPWIEGASTACVPDLPEGFPAWASVSLLYLGARAHRRRASTRCGWR